MESYYEINVSRKSKDIWGEKRWKHFFATAPRSIRNRQELKSILPEILRAFPPPEFEIKITYWEGVGHSVDAHKLLSEEEFQK